MLIFLFAAALMGQVDRIDLNGLQFQVQSTQSFKIHKTELPKTKSQKKRVVFDLSPAKLSPKAPHALVSSNKALSKVRIAQFNKNTVRVVAEVTGNPKLSLKRVTKNRDTKSPLRPRAHEEIAASPSVPRNDDAEPEAPKEFRIVIDPGHGGDDPGAIGKRGLREKDVTLSVSKRLKDLIEKRIEGAKVLLTRSDDRTLALATRTEFANRVKADLFISIHVNASPNASTQGVETYYLNITHDRYALRLAARENAMSESETSNLEFILADLAMKSSVTDSVRLGNIVQNSICDNLLTQWDGVQNLGLKSAMFYVLMGAKMPAILVEISFISNKTDEKRLKRDDYQQALAEGIVKGLERYSEEKVAAR